MNMIAKERMYTNAAQTRLVRAGSPDAAFLYATPGTEIPESAVKRFGIVNGRKFTKEPAPAKKAKTPAADKAKKPAENKGGLTITPLSDADKES